jgi:hypothetical protein
MATIIPSLTESNAWFWFDEKGREIKIEKLKSMHGKQFLRTSHKLKKEEREKLRETLIPNETTSVLVNMVGAIKG